MHRSASGSCFARRSPVRLASALGLTLGLVLGPPAAADTLDDQLGPRALAMGDSLRGDSEMSDGIPGVRDFSKSDVLSSPLTRDDAVVGTPLDELFAIRDTIIEIEVTPNRPDWLSHVGVARELAAWYGKPLWGGVGFSFWRGISGISSHVFSLTPGWVIES